jgi:hypothetical protein
VLAGPADHDHERVLGPRAPGTSASGGAPANRAGVIVANRARFSALKRPSRTRASSHSRRCERYEAQAETMRATFDSERGWGGILRGFAQAAAKV